MRGNIHKSTWRIFRELSSQSVQDVCCRNTVMVKTTRSFRCKLHQNPSTILGLKGNASEWFTRNIECPGRPLKDWSLESIIKGLQKIFLNSLTHRQVSNKLDTIKQGQKTVQEFIQELTKYTAQMVQYPDNYSFRRWLIATLRPSLQKEILHGGSLQNSAVCKTYWKKQRT